MCTKLKGPSKWKALQPKGIWVTNSSSPLHHLWAKVPCTTKQVATPAWPYGYVKQRWYFPASLVTKWLCKQDLAREIHPETLHGHFWKAFWTSDCYMCPAHLVSVIPPSCPGSQVWRLDFGSCLSPRRPRGMWGSRILGFWDSLARLPI